MKLYELDDSDALTDVAPDLGLDLSTGGRSLVSGPMQSDHRMDILANNENGCNFFFRNVDGETYIEEAPGLGISDCYETGRGMTLLDANGDGELDIVYGNWNGPHRLMIKGSSGYTNEVGLDEGFLPLCLNTLGCMWIILIENAKHRDE